jgi:hypothetical protein
VNWDKFGTEVYEPVKERWLKAFGEEFTGVRYRMFTIEDAYLATELNAFCSMCRAANHECYVDEKRGRLTSKRQTNDWRPSVLGMTGCCFHPTGNWHAGYVATDGRGLDPAHFAHCWNCSQGAKEALITLVKLSYDGHGFPKRVHCTPPQGESIDKESPKAIDARALQSQPAWGKKIFGRSWYAGFSAGETENLY